MHLIFPTTLNKFPVQVNAVSLNSNALEVSSLTQFSYCFTPFHISSLRIYSGSFCIISFFCIMLNFRVGANVALPLVLTSDRSLWRSSPCFRVLRSIFCGYDLFSCACVLFRVNLTCNMKEKLLTSNIFSSCAQTSP